MVRLYVLLAAAPVIARATAVLSEMHGGSFGGKSRWWLFALGYALLAAMTLSSVIDFFQFRGTLTQAGFVTASALLIAGERRHGRNPRRNCKPDACPQKLRMQP